MMDGEGDENKSEETQEILTDENGNPLPEEIEVEEIDDEPGAAQEDGSGEDKEGIKEWLADKLDKTLSPILDAVKGIAETQTMQTAELKRLKRKADLSTLPNSSQNSVPNSQTEQNNTSETKQGTSSETRTEAPERSEDGKPVAEALAKARREIHRL